MTIKIKDNIVNKTLHILAILYVREKWLHEESLLLPAVHKTLALHLMCIALQM